ncbi:MAG: Ribosome maturation factor RimM [Desulfovibrio sp.]
MTDSHLLPVGRIRKAHGIRGEVSIDYYADSPSLLHEGVYLRRAAEQPKFHKITSFRGHHGALLVRFATVPDRTTAETLRGCELLIPKERLPEPDGDAIYIHEILGLSVFAVTENGDEKLWGTIEDVSEPAGQELWAIAHDGEEDILFPAAPEFIRAFDLDKGRVTITPPPGLFELYRS